MTDGGGFVTVTTRTETREVRVQRFKCPICKQNYKPHETVEIRIDEVNSDMRGKETYLCLHCTRSLLDYDIEEKINAKREKEIRERTIEDHDFPAEIATVILLTTIVSIGAVSIHPFLGLGLIFSAFVVTVLAVKR